MPDGGHAELERTTISRKIGGKKEKFVATGEGRTFDGFLRNTMSFDDENEGTGKRPSSSGYLERGIEYEGYRRYRAFHTTPRYTEASLVRRLEEWGIGRPFTYAPTIQTIQNREYVVKGDKGRRAYL